MFSLIRAWTNGWSNNQDAGGLRRHRAHYNVTVTRVWKIARLQMNWNSGTFVDECVNTLRPRKYGRHLADIIKRISLNENYCIWIQVSLKYVPTGPVSMPALVQIMALCRAGEKSLSDPMATHFTDVYTVYPKKYAHGLVVLCFVVVMQSFIMNSHEVFIHIHQGCFAGTGAIVRLPQCQWSKPDGYGKISQCITTTKHSKAKTVCIFLGIYCMCDPASVSPLRR